MAVTVIAIAATAWTTEAQSGPAFRPRVLVNLGTAKPCPSVQSPRAFAS